MYFKEGKKYILFYLKFIIIIVYVSGSNITVSRFLVYRLIGPAQQLGLTLFPETPAPTLNCTQVAGVCVANANTTDGMLPSLNLDPDGSWTHSEDQCYCIEGHELVMLEGSDQCQGK